MDPMFNIDPQSYQTPIAEPIPGDYLPTEALRSAVEVAIHLQQPLLITGEPGTGKTRLAYALAHDLSLRDPDFHSQPLVFNTKTTSISTDLFYTYDAIKHFHDANIRKAEGQEAPDIARYIQLQALGKAIALSSTDEVKSGRFVEAPGQSPQSSVVLIDEIDKAPRDFPNDILNEIEHYNFRIKEANHSIQKGTSRGIIVILTSNSEKSLPDAFLRRVVFYHIPFPGPSQLVKIVRSRFPSFSQYTLQELVEHFGHIRQLCERKLPATAELLSWIHFLGLRGFLRENLKIEALSEEEKQTLEHSYSILAKTREDLQKIQKMLSQTH